MYSQLFRGCRGSMFDEATEKSTSRGDMLGGRTQAPYFRCSGYPSRRFLKHVGNIISLPKDEIVIPGT